MLWSSSWPERRRCRWAQPTSWIRLSGRSCSTAFRTTCGGTASPASGTLWGRSLPAMRSPSRAALEMQPLLVALDVDTAAHARSLVKALRGAVGGFKIGSRLFTTLGPAFVEELVSDGHLVFLDLKFHDIPHTVAGAVAAATRLGVWMVNVHASGGMAMMKAAREAAGDEAAARGLKAPLVIGVTLLTSLDQRAIGEVGIDS